MLNAIANHLNKMRTISMVIIFSLLLTTVLCATSNEKVDADSGTEITVGLDGYANYDYAYEVLNYVNYERSLVGAQPLEMDLTLLENAQQRAAECHLRFSHNRLNSDTIWSLIPGGSKAENIAIASGSPGAAMTQWMNSSGHRGNILSTNAKYIGVGAVRYTNPFTSQTTYAWVQLFSDSSTSTGSKPVNTNKTWIINIDSEYYPYTLYLHDSNTHEVSSSATMSPLSVANLKIRFLGYGDETWTNVYLSDSKLSWQSSSRGVAAVFDGELYSEKVGFTTLSAYTTGGTLLKQFDLTVLKKISDTNITPIENLYYSGFEIKPSLTVQDNGTTLVNGTDYTVTWYDNINVGTARAVITGKGYYTGTTTVTFKIITDSPIIDNVNITLNANGGTVNPQSLSIASGSEVGRLPIPIREGYTSNGWFTSDGKKVSANTVINSDTTLIAGWTPVSTTYPSADKTNTTPREKTTPNKKLSNAATLKGIKVYSGKLSPKFKKSTTSYKLKLSKNKKSVDIMPRLSNSKAKLQIKVGNGKYKNVKSIKVNLKKGQKKVVYVKVTAENKKAIKTYKITISRKK